MRFAVRLAAALLLPLLCATAMAQATAPAANDSALAAKPLPDLETLVLAAQSREKQDETIARKYIYREDTTVAINGGKHTIRIVDEVYWQDGVRVGRTLERDGKPLTEAELKKEDERNRKFVEKRQKDKAKEDARRAEDILPLSRLLELGTFSEPRREWVHERPTIAIDFVGNPKAKTRTDDEKVIHDLTGTIWLDETDHTVQHMEARLLKPFRVGGGLIASLAEGTTFSFVKRRVNDELWLPESQHLDGHFRFLLLIAGNGTVDVRMSDYRKFKATSTVLPGTEEVTSPQPPQAQTTVPMRSQ